MTAPWLPGEVEEPFQLATDRGDVPLERRPVEQVPLRRATRRVADHPRPAADESDRPPTEALEAQEPEDRHQVADVERVVRRVETDVACDRTTGRQPVSAAPASSPRGSPASAAPRAGRTGSRPPPWVVSVTGSRVESSRRGGRPASVHSRPLCYRAATDADHSRASPAPSSGAPATAARTDRIDHRSDRRRRPRPSAPHHRARRGHRRGLCRGRLQPLRRGPPRPGRSAQQHRFRAADGHLRPDRQGRARPARRPQARARHIRPAARRDRRRHDRHRGQGLLDQPGLRSRGHRVGRTRHRLGPAARRIDDHPAARPRAAPAARGVRGLHVRAQGARDHPVDPPDPGLPG